jgi:hypothetical protein
MVESMAIIGLAAGTTPRQATQVFGPLPIDGFEIDPQIIQVGREYFDMTQPNLNAIAKTGAWAWSAAPGAIRSSQWTLTGLLISPGT